MKLESDALQPPPFDITGDLDTPVSAFMKLAAFQPRFLLESVEGGERLGRYSFIGFGDGLEVRLDGQGLWVDGRPQGMLAVWSAMQPTTWCVISSACPCAAGVTRECRHCTTSHRARCSCSIT